MTINMVKTEPIVLFDQWYSEAKKHPNVGFAEAACLSTIGEEGYPDARYILVKSFDDNGFVFYTNRNSSKGHQLNQNPKAQLTFYWNPLGYQIRIQGDIVLTSKEDNDDYFATRPRGSQIGAWASQQSESYDTRETFLAEVAAAEQRFSDSDVPRPAHWIGYLLKPKTIEFWKDEPNRLHERRQFQKDARGDWTMKYLYP